MMRGSVVAAFCIVFGCLATAPNAEAKWFTKFVQRLTSVAEKLQQKVKNATATVKEITQQLAKDVKSDLRANWKAISDTFKKVWEGIRKQPAVFRDAFKAGLKALQQSPAVVAIHKALTTKTGRSAGKCAVEFLKGATLGTMALLKTPVDLWRQIRSMVKHAASASCAESSDKSTQDPNDSERPARTGLLCGLKMLANQALNQVASCIHNVIKNPKAAVLNLGKALAMLGCEELGHHVGHSLLHAMTGSGWVHALTKIIEGLAKAAKVVEKIEHASHIVSAVCGGGHH